MPKFAVTGVVTGSKYLGEFEADSPEAAVALALNSEEARVDMCHSCADQCEDAEVNDAIASLIEE